MDKNPPLQLFDLDDMIQVALEFHRIDNNLDYHSRWTRYCECLNDCGDLDWLKAQFEAICIRIAKKTNGFRPVLPTDIDRPIRAIVWASFEVCVAVSRNRLDAGELLRKTSELNGLLHGPRITNWWWDLLKTGAKSKAGTSLGGRTTAEIRCAEHQRWFNAAEVRQNQPDPPTRNSRREAIHVIAKLGLPTPMDTVRSALRRLRKRKSG